MIITMATTANIVPVDTIWLALYDAYPRRKADLIGEEKI